jgi:hypothetical protein
MAVLAGKGDGTFDPYVAFATGMGPHVTKDERILRSQFWALVSKGLVR